MIRTLIIDDDKTTNFLNQYQLIKHGGFGKIFVAKNGAEALKYLIGSSDNRIYPNIIFLDLAMPDITGWEILEKIKSYDTFFLNKTKIFIISNVITEEDIFLAKKIHKKIECLTKPLNQELIDKVYNLTNKNIPS